MSNTFRSCVWVFFMFCFSFNRAFGATSLCDCPNIYEQYCCSVSPVCCAANAAACESKCGIGGGEVGGCPSDCPSTSEWTPMGNNKEGKCVILIPGFGEPSEASCTVRCVEGYYDIGGTTGINCKTCPANATCPAGSDMKNNTPICNKNYYGLIDLFVRPSVYNCVRCPQIIGPTGRPGYGITKSSGAKSITECYISSGTYKDETGTFEIGNDCYYSE